MKHFLKGLAALAIVLVISMAIHIFCNMNGISLDNSIMTTVLSACLAVFIYQQLIKNEKDKES
jgi:chromate transport protein ChrA